VATAKEFQKIQLPVGWLTDQAHPSNNALSVLCADNVTVIQTQPGWMMFDLSVRHCSNLLAFAQPSVALRVALSFPKPCIPMALVAALRAIR
jgi:hypothetical protein